MYNHAPENYVCPLCQIARGEPTSQGSQEEVIIYGDRNVTAFIAGRQWRSNPGHVIIIPNLHTENIYNMRSDLGSCLFDVTKLIARTLKTVYSCDGVTIIQNNEPAGGQETWHYHVHVIPRMNGDCYYHDLHDTYWPDMDEKRPYADKLRTFIQK